MSERDPAAARWAAIQLARVCGVACALLGIAIILRRVPALAWVPGWVGYVVLAAGLVDVFVVPLLLARRWRTPPR